MVQTSRSLEFLRDSYLSISSYEADTMAWVYSVLTEGTQFSPTKQVELENVHYACKPRTEQK